MWQSSQDPSSGSGAPWHKLLLVAASLRADKLRMILLLDPEFNLNNKILGRSLMSQTEKFSQMPAEQ